jgi:hypothetical protein
VRDAADQAHVEEVAPRRGAEEEEISKAGRQTDNV